MHPIVRDEVYRIGYEAIRNSGAHSGGDRLDVELIYGQDLALRVRDNGKGIAPEIVASGREGHYGLKGMQERAARIGGKFNLNSTSSGTEVKLVIPGKIVFRHSNPGGRTLFTKIRELLGLSDRSPNLNP
jgi:signal transduction histidine kinase